MCCITMCYTRLLLEFALSTCVYVFLRIRFIISASFARSRSRSIDRERDHDIFSTIYFLTHDFPIFADSTSRSRSLTETRASHNCIIVRDTQVCRTLTRYKGRGDAMKHKVFRLMRTLRIFKDTLPGLNSRVSQRRRVSQVGLRVQSLCDYCAYRLAVTFVLSQWIKLEDIFKGAHPPNDH